MAADDLTGRSVLVTGGTGDVGRAILSAFARTGARVFFQFSSDEEGADSVRKQTGALPIRVDFSKDFAPPEEGRFDILVNNAGINISSSISHEVSDTDWWRTLRVNLHAPFVLSRACLPHMVRNKWGRIINISSIYGHRAVEGNLPYTVSKHGLAGLTRTIAREYAADGVTCNEICPGPVEGAMMRRIADEEARSGSSTARDYLRSVAQEIPAKRMAKPSDVASLVVFLASNAASYLNGASIPVDGALIT